jgi:hypothetical protein
MDTLDRELETLVEQTAPPLLDLAELERLVTADEMLVFDGECAIHDGCRPIIF